MFKTKIVDFNDGTPQMIFNEDTPLDFADLKLHYNLAKMRSTKFEDHYYAFRKGVPGRWVGTKPSQSVDLFSDV